MRVSAVSGSTRALARGAVRLARRLGSNRFIGEAPMKTAEAAVLPGTGRTARSSLPEQSLFAKGRWYYPRLSVACLFYPFRFHTSRLNSTLRRPKP
jgi:hypothetical protein